MKAQKIELQISGGMVEIFFDQTVSNDVNVYAKDDHTHITRKMLTESDMDQIYAAVATRLVEIGDPETCDIVNRGIQLKLEKELGGKE